MLPGRGGRIGQWMLTEEAIRTEEERVTWQETAVNLRLAFTPYKMQG